jgi:hypothetical protein
MLYQVKDEYGGRQTKCRQCGQAMIVPGTAATAGIATRAIPPLPKSEVAAAGPFVQSRGYPRVTVSAKWWLVSLTAGMFLLLVVLALAIWFSVPRKREASGYDLRGEAPKIKDVLRKEWTMSQSNGTLVARIGRQEVLGSAKISSKKIEEVEVLEIRNRAVIKYKQTIVLDILKMTFNVGDKPTVQTKHSPLEGESIVHELSHGTWSRKFPSKAPSPEQQELLNSLDPHESDDLMYPDKPVNPGHTWTVEGASLRKFLGPNFLSVTGQASLIFEKLSELDSEPCAYITMYLEVKGKMLDRDNDELIVEMGGTGYTYRSLRKRLNLKTKLRGQMKVHGTCRNKGMNLDLEIKGPFVMEQATTQR